MIVQQLIFYEKNSKLECIEKYTVEPRKPWMPQKITKIERAYQRKKLLGQQGLWKIHETKNIIV